MTGLRHSPCRSGFVGREPYLRDGERVHPGVRDRRPLAGLTLTPGHPHPKVKPMTTSDPILPYGTGEDANSGYAAGSPTSETRARNADRDGTTSKRQADVLALLDRGWLATIKGQTVLHLGQVKGVTWRELADYLDLHHGQASGVLSVLHKAGKIARLTERRNRCSVYVLPEYVYGRDTEPHGTRGRQPETQLAVDLVAAEAAIRRVRAIHTLRVVGPWCGECFADYPCPTIRALDGASIRP